MKNVIAITLILTIIFSLTTCSSKSSANTSNPITSKDPTELTSTVTAKPTSAIQLELGGKTLNITDEASLGELSKEIGFKYWGSNIPELFDRGPHVATVKQYPDIAICFKLQGEAYQESNKENAIFLLTLVDYTDTAVDIPFILPKNQGYIAIGDPVKSVNGLITYYRHELTPKGKAFLLKIMYDILQNPTDYISIIDNVADFLLPEPHVHNDWGKNGTTYANIVKSLKSTNIESDFFTILNAFEREIMLLGDNKISINSTTSVHEEATSNMVYTSSTIEQEVSTDRLYITSKFTGIDDLNIRIGYQRIKKPINGADAGFTHLCFEIALLDNNNRIIQAISSKYDPISFNDTTYFKAHTDSDPPNKEFLSINANTEYYMNYDYNLCERFDQNFNIATKVKLLEVLRDAPQDPTHVFDIIMKKFPDITFTKVPASEITSR